MMTAGIICGVIALLMLGVCGLAFVGVLGWLMFRKKPVASVPGLPAASPDDIARQETLTLAVREFDRKWEQRKADTRSKDFLEVMAYVGEAAE